MKKVSLKKISARKAASLSLAALRQTFFPYASGQMTDRLAAHPYLSCALLMAASTVYALLLLLLDGFLLELPLSGVASSFLFAVIASCSYFLISSLPGALSLGHTLAETVRNGSLWAAVAKAPFVRLLESHSPITSIGVSLVSLIYFFSFYQFSFHRFTFYLFTVMIISAAVRITLLTAQTNSGDKIRRESLIWFAALFLLLHNIFLIPLLTIAAISIAFLFSQALILLTDKKKISLNLQQISACGIVVEIPLLVCGIFII